MPEYASTIIIIPIINIITNENIIDFTGLGIINSKCIC